MFMVSASTAETIEEANGYYVTLDISQYRDDVLIDRRVITDDYILRNYAYMWLNMFAGKKYASADDDYKIVDVNNVEYAFKSISVHFGGAGVPSYVGLGTGTSPVAVTDYHLQTRVLSEVVTDSTIWVSGNEFNVTADSTLVVNGTYSITESGLIVGYGTTIGTKMFLICRDVFDAIEVNNADVIIIRYIFRFNVGL